MARAGFGRKEEAGNAAVARVEAQMIEEARQQGRGGDSDSGTGTRWSAGAIGVGAAAVGYLSTLAVELAASKTEHTEDERIEAAKEEVRRQEEAALQRAQQEAAEQAAARAKIAAAAKVRREARAAAEREAVEQQAAKKAAEEKAAAAAAAERAAAAKARAAEHKAAVERAEAEATAKAEAERAAASEIAAAAERAAAAQERERREAADARAKQQADWWACPTCHEPSRELCEACTVSVHIPSGTSLGFGLDELDDEQLPRTWPRRLHVYIDETVPGSFAATHGLHVGLALTAINGAPTLDMHLQAVIELLRASAHDTLVLSFVPLSEVEPGKTPPAVEAPAATGAPQAIWQAREISTSGSDAKERPPFDPAAIGAGTVHGLKAQSDAADGEAHAKPNQDRGLVCWPYAGVADAALLAVFDGHGPHGERIAHFCMGQLARTLAKEEAATTSGSADPGQALRRAVVAIDGKLATCKEIVAMDHTGGAVTLAPTVVHRAGTTCTAVLLRGRSCWVAWSGDSRCVLGSRVSDGSLVAMELSDDHRPDAPGERRRLEKAGGIITAAGPGGKPPSRVFTRGAAARGVAMARSLGDLDMRQVGVIAEPEIRHVDISIDQGAVVSHGIGGEGEGRQDELLIVASDGVWEFIESQEACELVAKIEHASEAADALVQEAVRRWVQHEHGLYQDDITAIVVKLPLLARGSAAAAYTA